MKTSHRVTSTVVVEKVLDRTTRATITASTSSSQSRPITNSSIPKQAREEAKGMVATRHRSQDTQTSKITDTNSPATARRCQSKDQSESLRPCLDRATIIVQPLYHQ